MKSHLAFFAVVTVSAASTIGCSLAPVDDATGTAGEAVTDSTGQSMLLAGQSLTVGQYLRSPSGQFKFLMQGDGNAVVYETGGIAKWATGTNGKGGTSVYMNPDGELQVLKGKTQIWPSNTNVADSKLVLSNDGSLAILRPNGAPVFWTGSAIGASSVAQIILQESRDYHVSDNNLASMVGVAACESHLEPAAQNPSGATGLFQFLAVDPDYWDVYRREYFDGTCPGVPGAEDATCNAQTAAYIIGTTRTFFPSPWQGSWGIDPYLAWVSAEEANLPCGCRDALVSNGVSSIAGSSCY